MKKNKNPLLNITNLPQFALIKPKHIHPAITQLIEQNRTITKLLLTQEKFSWDNLMDPLEAIGDKLATAWGAISHLNGVNNSPELRKAYESCLPLITAYYTELGQNTELFNAIKSIAKSQQFKRLSSVQQKIIRDELRDFRLAGVALPPDKKQQFADLQQQLSDLTNKFANNVLDATKNWSLHLRQRQVKGIPEHALAIAHAKAKKQHKSGWLFGLDFPSYYAVVTYADDRTIRKQIYTAYVTRASEVGPNARKWDNSKIMHEILTIRRQLARMLDFNNFAEYSLATKMARRPQTVLKFLHDLANHSLKVGKKEFAALQQFAKQNGCNKLAPWDLAYYSEKLQQQQFNITQEELRPYFPINQVTQGLFTVAERLYDMKITEKKAVSVWHPEVKFYEVRDKRGKLRGQFYFDLYTRPSKRNGAWMDECKSRRYLKNGVLQIPVAYVICNFTPPVKNQPALITHNEVTTLFHEFGHCLHHVLTQIDYAAAAGIKGVPWDAVEMPSQLMENWCWQPEALKLIAKHYQTGAPLPDVLLQKLLQSKNYQAALHMLRQLEFALFDFRLHLEFDPKITRQLKTIVDQVRRKVCITPTVKFNRMAHSFSHIFAGGYAAGYYSYKWAEVLSADAFSKFEECGIFDRHTGQEFLHHILEAGGSEDPMVLFKKFRGRKPKVKALLKQSGII